MPTKFSLACSPFMRSSRETKAPPNDGAGAKPGSEQERSGSIFQVSLNRAAIPALERSVPAVKADAARSLFSVQCKKIVWAVLDSGIQNNHDAFMTSEKQPTSRVRKIFDFTNIREIVSSEREDVDEQGLNKLVTSTGLSKDEVGQYLKEIADDFAKERPINWAVVEKLITVKNLHQTTNLKGCPVRTGPTLPGSSVRTNLEMAGRRRMALHMPTACALISASTISACSARTWRRPSSQ